MGDVVEDRRHHRQQGRPESMLPDDRPLRQALGAGGADVVLPQHLPAGGGRLTDEVAQAAQADHPRRQDQMQQQISHASPAAGGVHPRRREPAQHHGEEKDRQHAQEKAGGAEAQQGQSPRQLSPAGLGLPGRHDTQGDAKENGCRHPRPRQDEGRHHPLGDHGDDGLARAVGEAQVAL